MPTRRQLRVNHLLQQEISEIVRSELYDTDIGFATITGVEVSPDLQHARVYVSVMGEDSEVRSSMAALGRTRGIVRAQLAQRLHLKHTPELTFERDETARGAQQIESLIAEFQPTDEAIGEDAQAAETEDDSPARDYGATVARIAELLKRQLPTVILIHYDPDGDAIGSGLALSLALEQLGQVVPVLCADPVPARYRFLPGAGRVTSALPGHYEVAILVDAGDHSQLGQLAGSTEQASTVVWIDHHQTNRGGADIDYLDASAAATALQVFRVIKALDIPVTKDIATCLYCGLATDTGFFTFENTSAEALTTAGALVAAGADPFRIATEVQERIRMSAARLRGRALASLATAADGHIVYAILTPGDFATARADREDTENIIDLLKLVAGGQVQVLFKAISHNLWRVSLRSAVIDVAAIAKQFDGGGHVPAAGCLIAGPLPQVRAAVIRAISDVLEPKR